MPRLVGRAGPALLAAEFPVGLHHAPGHAARRLLQPDPRAAHEVERADIEGGANGDECAAFDQPFGEQRAGIAVVERAIYMRRGNRQEARRAEQACALGDDAHRHRGALAPVAGGNGALFGGEVEAHARCFRKVMDVGRTKPACALRAVSTKPMRWNKAWLSASSTRVSSSSAGLFSRRARSSTASMSRRAYAPALLRRIDCQLADIERIGLFGGEGAAYELLSFRGDEAGFIRRLQGKR